MKTAYPAWDHALLARQLRALQNLTRLLGRLPKDGRSHLPEWPRLAKVCFANRPALVFDLETRVLPGFRNATYSEPEAATSADHR
jgi:hypothetical protein